MREIIYRGKEKKTRTFHPKETTMSKCKECGGIGWQFEYDPVDERELHTPSVRCPSCGGSGNMKDCIQGTGEARSCEKNQKAKIKKPVAYDFTDETYHDYEDQG